MGRWGSALAHCILEIVTDGLDGRMGLPDGSGLGALPIGESLDAEDWAEKEFNGAPLGVLGRNQTGAESRGLHLHSTLVVTTEGLPLGLLKGQLWAPRPKKASRRSPNIPIEEQETFCWMEGLGDCVDLAHQMLHTRQVCVMDRGADIFELFHEQRENPCVDVLVRANYNRCTTEDVKLFDAVRKTKAKGVLGVDVHRQSARPKRSKKRAKPKRAARSMGNG